MQEVKKIVILGPESTGKSTLCKHLADHYHTFWCPEYARDYLLEHGKDYTYDDLLVIAKGQINMEDEYVYSIQNSKFKIQNSGANFHLQPSNLGLPTSNIQLLFIDTNMYVMKVWCEFVFGNCHQFILNEIVKRKYDLYLLCNIDLPWVKDELREYPDLKVREQLYHIYKDLMINQDVPWIDIHGNHAQRKQIAIEAIDNLSFESS